jgi:organic radical activating enzyme
MTINTENNKSICKYPWDHSYIGSQYERKLCCISDDLVSEEKKETKDFWNSSVMKDVRKKMIAGKKINACSVCYKNEEQNIESLRQQSWKGPENEEKLIADVVSKTDDDGSVSELPTYFDYRTIHCNLQCISCGSLYSSKHASLYSEMWNSRPKMFPSGKEFVIDYKFEDSMAEEIIECLDKRRLTKIYWAGGEPMMSGVHWKVVDKLLEIQSIDPTYIFSIFVHYNTNLTRLHWKGKIIPELLEFYQPSIQASLDGTHETFEFCRDGASWETVSTNWKEYHSRLNKRNQFGLSSIMSAPVLMDIDRWFEFYELSETWQKVLNYSKSTHYSLISLFWESQISESLIKDSSYELQKRGGWIYSSSGHQLLRKSMQMFTEGSVFETQPVGQLADVTPDRFKQYRNWHFIYRSGISLSIPIKLPSNI